jgi:hypothetical protein
MILSTWMKRLNKNLDTLPPMVLSQIEVIKMATSEELKNYGATYS